jgi:hypothetical protein
MFAALKGHWPEYLMEAAGLGIFVVSICVFGALLEYPLSPVRQTICDPTVRTILLGQARGLIAVGLVYSPWGKQSGPTSTRRSRCLSGGWGMSRPGTPASTRQRSSSAGWLASC